MLLFNRFWFKDLSSGTRVIETFEKWAPGLLKIRLTVTGLSLWFCLHKFFDRKWYASKRDTSIYATRLQCHYFVNTRADLATERERHWTTGKPADRAKLDFWCRCAISQASCLIYACRRQLTFPFLARNLVPRASALGTRCLRAFLREPRFPRFCSKRKRETSLME